MELNPSFRNISSHILCGTLFYSPRPFALPRYLVGYPLTLEALFPEELAPEGTRLRTGFHPQKSTLFGYSNQRILSEEVWAMQGWRNGIGFPIRKIGPARLDLQLFPRPTSDSETGSATALDIERIKSHPTSTHGVGHAACDFSQIRKMTHLSSVGAY